MSQNSQTRPPSMKSTQLQTSSLPPNWEIFNSIDAGRKQTIYRQMCDQIQSQQKQILGLIDKVKQNELRSSNNLGDSKVFEDMRRLKTELEQAQETILDQNEQISSLQIDNRQLTHQMDQLHLQFQKLQSMHEPEEGQSLPELRKALQNKDNTIDELRMQVQQLIVQMNQAEVQYDQQLKSYNKEKAQLLHNIDNQEQQLYQLHNENTRLQQDYDQLNDRLNSNKDYHQFEETYKSLNQQFTQIKNQYQNMQQKIKLQEVAIEDLIAENSRLVIDTYKFV